MATVETRFTATGVAETQAACGNVARGLSSVAGGATSAKSSLEYLSGALQGLALGAVVKDAISAALQMERLQKMFTAASGSATLAAKELEYVRAVSTRMGLDLATTADSYGKFLANIRSTTLEGEKGRKVFESISGAASALGLSVDTTNRAFTAINQMLGKGKVSAEELRQQWSEAIPGGFRLAADAMNMTTAKLDKALESGKIMAEDLLPKLADQLDKKFGGAALSAQNQLNLMNNAIFEAKAAFGSALIPSFTDFAKSIIPAINLLKEFIGGLQIISIKAVGWLDKWRNGNSEEVDKRVEETIADLMKRYTVQGSDYSALERAKQAGNKPQTGLADGKGAEAAKKWASTYEQLRKEIDLLNPSMTELDRKILDVTQKYADLERKKGGNIEKLRQLKAEHVDAIRTQYEIAEAIKATSKEFQEYFRIVGDESAWSQTADSIDEQHRLFRESIRLMDPAAKAAQELANGIYDIGRAFEAANQAGAVENFINNLFKLEELKKSIADSNISMITDPYEQQSAMIEARYQREIELIGEKMNALREAGLQESAIYQALTDDVLTKAQKRDKDLLDNQLKQSKAGWDGVVNQAQKAFPKLTGLDKAITAVFKDHAVMRRNVSGELVKDETASNLSMYSAYGAAAAGIFEGMAAAQDTTTRQGFEAAQDYNLAAAFMSTASGMMAQLAGPDGWSPSAWGRAAVVGLMGAIQIAQIASTTFGGGGSVASAPSGTFASTGASSGSSNGLGNLATPLSSIQDNRTAETYERMIASSDSVVEAIGKLSKSIDDLTDLFSEGGAGYILATNAPNRGMTVDLTKQSSPFGFGALKTEIGNSLGVNGISNFVLNGISGGIAGLIGSIFSSENRITEAGIALGVTAGEIMAQQFSKREVGNWWTGSKTRMEYTPDAELTRYVQAMLQPWVNEITNMAKTLGTTVDLTKTTVEMTNIATAGGKPEEIAKKLEEWSLKALQGFALGVEGLTGPGGYIADYDDAYAALKRLNDAIVTLKDSFLLIGKTVVEGSMANAQAADSLITLMGGVDDFNESINTYFTSMFTDAEQEAATFAEAQRSVNSMFIELNRAVPSTREEFRSLINGLDITTVTGAQTFAALMSVSEAFGTMMTAADELAEQRRDLDIQIMELEGNTAAATAARRADELALLDASLRPLQERIYALEDEAQALELTKKARSMDIQIMELSGNASGALAARRADELAALDVSLRPLQERIYALQDEKTAATEATQAASTLASQLKGALDSATTALRASFSAEKERLTTAYNAELAAMTTRLDATKTVVSDLTSSLNKLTAARERMRLQDEAASRAEYTAAQARMAAVLVQARGGDLSGLKDIDSTLETLTGITAESYSSSEDYQRDFWQAKNGILELEKLTGNQLTDAQRAMQLAETQIDVLKTNHDAQLSALDAQLNATLGINTGLIALADAIRGFQVAQAWNQAKTPPAAAAAASPAANAAILSYVDNAIATYGGTDIAAMDVYQAAKANNVTAAQLAEATNAKYGWTVTSINEWAKSMGLPSFDVGTPYVPYDMTANIHQGEIVMDRASSDVLRKYGIPTYGSADNSALADEVRELRKENRELNSKLERLLSRIADSSDSTSRAVNGNPGAPLLVEVVNG